MAVGDQNLVYGSAAAMTITLASLATSAGGVTGRASTAIDNTTLKAIDYLVKVIVKNGAGAIAANKGWWIYGYGGDIGNGSTYVYDDGITGTDAAFTRTDPPNLAQMAFLNAPTSATPYTSREYSMAALFGGTLPPKFGVFIANDTNIAADATAGNFAVYVTPVYSHQS